MFEASQYAARRRALMRSVKTGCIVLPGNDLVGMNYHANTFPFRQDGSFLYFAGLNEPAHCLWLDCESGQEMLYGPSLGLDHTIWSGAAQSLQELAASAGIAGVGTMPELAAACHEAQKQGREVHYLPPYQGDGVLRLCRLLGAVPENVEAGASQALIHAVVALRSVKSGEEVDEIRRAIALSAEMYAELMAACAPGAAEIELYGRLQGLILARGSREAFPMILSRRGEVLHNHTRDQILCDGDLLLVDSGVCSPLGYVSDITRTLPVGGEFSARQKEIYEIVLDALAAGTACMAPGVPFVDCHFSAAKAVASGLTSLGLMRGDPLDAVAQGAHALFFPHGLGHMLGLDVHDMEALGEDSVGYDHEFKRAAQFGLSGLRMARRLRPGFVMTVEPGIYFIPALIRQWREERRLEEFINYGALDAYLDFGGIRIEDDVLVTEDGRDVLSKDIPKRVDDICKRMGEAS
ncbi:MAG: Xaa-Pro aminopeptidase [Deltaproteobacteria bacterium HGW-Deltaproteobacteria-18]|jgi:Xaa-Pro aminopeptidase|nr:MAG: Xaa-Pro aminopeptidase [Deltaproteobacteria bacterium HGW-Deltaproteobacteria-18]